jgi:hypothetical protein
VGVGLKTTATKLHKGGQDPNTAVEQGKKKKKQRAGTSPITSYWPGDRTPKKDHLLTDIIHTAIQERMEYWKHQI